MNDLELRVRQLEEKLSRLEKSDRFIFKKHLQLLDGNNIQVSKTFGTKIATETTQKLGFFGKTPIVQVSAISAPSGGATQDAESRTAINSIRSALTNLGLTA